MPEEIPENSTIEAALNHAETLLEEAQELLYSIPVMYPDSRNDALRSVEEAIDAILDEKEIYDFPDDPDLVESYENFEISLLTMRPMFFQICNTPGREEYVPQSIHTGIVKDGKEVIYQLTY